jgi:hypothetical protein
MTNQKCPSNADLTKAITHGPTPEMARHLETCLRCADDWHTQHRIAALAAKLPRYPLSESTGENIRTVIVADSNAATSAGTAERKMVIWIAAASLIFLTVGMWLFRQLHDHNDNVSPVSIDAPIFRAELHPQDGARYKQIAAQPDEIVRVFEGSVTFSVDALLAGERFRVITGDAEIEVVGTVFEIVVKNDILETVHVISGTVEVRPHEREIVVLQQSDWWCRKMPPIQPMHKTFEAERVKEDEIKTVDSKTRKAVRRTQGNENTPPPPRQGDTDTSNNLEVRFNSGWQSFRQGNFAMAAGAFESVYLQEKKHTLREDALYWCGIAYFRAGNRLQANSAMTQYFKDYPNGRRRLDVAVRLGWMALDDGHFKKAETYFQVGITSANSRIRKSAKEGLAAAKSSSPRDLQR